MKTVVLTRGLPASGKSTWAKKKILNNKGNWKRVNKDELRLMIDAGQWSKSNEKMIVMARNALINLFLSEGKSVIVDDTNFHQSHHEAIKQIAEKHGAKFEIKDFEVDYEVAVERDLKRPSPVGERVIKKMYDQFVKPLPLKYEPPADGEEAILCDIDGTVALMNGRGPFDWHRVHEDDINEPVVGFVRDLMKFGRKVVYLSGRDGSCYEKTYKWLKENGLLNPRGETELFMRSAGDNRKDYVVKRELFDKHISDRYRVLFVVDDRSQVVDMWRQMGLTVLQVAEGNF